MKEVYVCIGRKRGYRWWEASVFSFHGGLREEEQMVCIHHHVHPTYIFTSMCRVMGNVIEPCQECTELSFRKHLFLVI